MELFSELAKYGRLLHEKDLVIGAGGNISLRDGEYICIKKQGEDMSSSCADTFDRVLLNEANSAGHLSTETPFHVACYKAAKEVKAVIHVHSPHIVAAGNLIKVLESPSYEFECILGPEIPVIEYVKPGSGELALEIGEQVKKGAKGVIMKQHGAVTVGQSLQEAYVRMLALERGCLIYLYSQLGHK